MSDLRDFTGKNRQFTGTDAETISKGTTGERVDGQAKIRFNTTTNLMEYYTGTEWKSIDAPPIITGFTLDGGSDVTSGTIDSTISGNITIEVKGSLFDTTGANVTFVGTGETLTPVTTTRNNSSLLTVTIARSDFDSTNEPYAIKVTNGSGLSAELAGAISADSPVTFINAADTTVSIFDGGRGSVNIAAADLCGATDADGDTITYSISSGSLPAGLSIASSTGVISGSASAVGSDTTSTFTVQAATTDLTITRQFKITIKAPVTQSFTSTGAGTFTVPTGLTSVDVLVVAGGGGSSGGIPNSAPGAGGGAGGLIYVPGFTVTPGASVPYNVGGGGSGQPGTGYGQDGQNSTFDTLTAIGGGGAAGWSGQTGRAGGSGAGGSIPNAGGGPGQQPSQPGQSGQFGFGNPGGSGQSYQNPGNPNSGGGGGAGGSGSPSGPGGVGRAYSISGSSTYYAGGGSGGGSPKSGGQGGGGSSPGPTSPGTPGSANRGGGGGGGSVSQADSGPTSGGSGGSGIVIISY